MDAPEKFARWLAAHEHPDPNYGWVYRYHPRSDAHSVALCELILEDLLWACDALRTQAADRKVVYGINYKHRWSTTGKQKTLDLAIGTAAEVDDDDSFLSLIHRGRIDRVLLSCEAKTVMTEHGKSQPRVFDELGSSHEIVHQGDPEALAAGVAVVNIAQEFVSPLRQRGGELHVSKHHQPRAAQRM
ncbi:MAG: hypothetical protein WD069_02755, partial [Planctomycetales bacterium]